MCAARVGAQWVSISVRSLPPTIQQIEKGDALGASAVPRTALYASEERVGPCVSRKARYPPKPYREIIMSAVKAIPFAVKDNALPFQDTSSPPNSIFTPSLLPRLSIGLLVGGNSVSKLSLRLASRAAAGVLPAATGVRLHAACAGLGVTLTKSAKLKFEVPGVCGPKFRNPAPLVPGVMCELGRGVDMQGGVEGARGGAAVLPRKVMLVAGEGEVARYMSRSTPSSPS